ncbi:phosphotransferase [Streptomyces acidicola]|uniref:phosphotransferase n=1 Tax=Streptomyces acidicola TaxID=2596892 RepID=UPI0038289FCC
MTSIQEPGDARPGAAGPMRSPDVTRSPGTTGAAAAEAWWPHDARQFTTAGERRSHGAPAFTAAEARRVLDAACAAAGFDSRGARTLRLGENAVHLLASAPVVVRIARDATRLPEVRRELAVAAWLQEAGFPAVRPRAGVPQAEVHEGRIVTFWQWLPDHGGTADFPALAAALAALHRLPFPSSEGPVLPVLDPLRGAGQHLAAGAGHVADADLEFLARRVGELREEYRALEFVLPPGPVHGDAHKGNFLRTASGWAAVLDLECFAHGPREWDLATALGVPFKGFGWLDEDGYRCSAEVYGFDVTAWTGFDVLRRIRETTMTTALMRDVGHSAEARAEFTRRLRTVRDGRPPRDWRRF